METNKDTELTKKEKVLVILLVGISLCLSLCISWWLWVDFDCYMRYDYACKHNYEYVFTKEQCLAKRKLEGHWY